MQLYRFPRRAAPAALALALVTASTGAASARPDSLAMTCRQTASLVAQQGGVVIGTGPNIYDRYVSSLAFCSGAEQLKPEWVKTRDNPQCFIGYTCFVPTRDNFGER
ncbi:hypothetical protein ABLE93_16795 [Xanthobacter sp. KR7-65]|uniref:hypothetical protein n=1 Tax=Xanthobacter sp. KR7-65 TaxID=3156612 RepID=UPI0032B3C781